MTKEDYFKYYIQGSEHYLIPKDVFDELFNEMESWKEDTQKYKEAINKLIEYLQEKYDSSSLCGIVLNFTEFEDIKDILKEAK